MKKVVFVLAFCFSFLVAGDVEKDIEAKTLYKKSCDGGDGCLNLGLMYERGKGVKQDFHKVKIFDGKACYGGIQMGCDSYKVFNMKGY